MSVVLYRLVGSPNNLKVEAALRYKSIPFKMKDFSPFEREATIELTGQPLMPVIEHGAAKLFGSGAILRYLDCNFPGTPQLFSSEFESMKAIERFELEATTDWIRPTGLVFRQAIAKAPDFEICKQACELATKTSKPLEEHLAKQPWLVGERLTAADIVGACSWIYCSMPEWMQSMGPLQAFFNRHLKFNEPRPHLERWINSIAKYLEP